MSSWIEIHPEAITQQALSEAIFSGRILYFEHLAPMVQVIKDMQALLQEAFAPHDPESAHELLTTGEHQARFAAADQAFRANAHIGHNIHLAIGAAGAYLPDTFCDRLRLRASPPQHRSSRAFHRSSTPPHRDSWGSAILSQINWWFPIFPLHRDRTLAIYPAHWSHGVTNNAKGWDWTKAGKEPSTPRLPTALSELDTHDEIRVTIAPGTLMAFSAAHLHAGVQNTTPLTRFSMETRTIYLNDLQTGRGASAIDGLGERAAYEWFHRIADGRALVDVLAEERSEK